MEDIATAAQMSKRTVYARYSDKAELFRAAVQFAIERYTLPIEAIREIATGDLDSTLVAIARLRIANVATPVGTKLQRILSIQSYRFPDLLDTAFERGTGPTIQFLAELFEEHRQSGKLDIDEPRRAAVAFLSLALGPPTRALVAGNALSKDDLERHIRFAVDLFLNGVLPR